MHTTTSQTAALKDVSLSRAVDQHSRALWAAAPLLRSFRELTAKRVGILGGSFDPVHTGHIAIAEAARRAFALDAVVFVPAKQNPLKPGGPQASDADRLEMLLRAVEVHPGLYVSPADIRRDGPSYAVDLMREVRAEVGPGTNLFFIIGSDCLADLHRWRDPAALFQLTEFIVCARDGFTEGQLRDATPALSAEQRALLGRGVLATTTESAASRRIRALLEAGQMPGRDLPPRVADYIDAQRLYGYVRPKD